MKVIYVAGPFRGPNAWKVECNVRRAEELGFEVSELGAMPLIPHTNTRFFNGTLTDQFWLDGTLELLKRCDAAIFTPDWPLSTGAKSERLYCNTHDIPVFDSLAELNLWLRESP